MAKNEDIGDLLKVGYNPKRNMQIYTGILAGLLFAPIVALIWGKYYHAENIYQWVGNTFCAIGVISLMSSRFAGLILVDELLLATKKFLGTKYKHYYSEFEKCFKRGLKGYYLDIDLLEKICKNQKPVLLEIKAAMISLSNSFIMQFSLSGIYGIVLFSIGIFLISK